MEKKAVKRADAIIVVDSTIGRWARSELGADRKKVFLIPNGVDTEMFSPDRGGEEGGSKEKEIKVERGRFRRGKEIRRRCKLEDDGRLIVCIRRFAPKNGVENVLEGFIEYVKEYDGGVEKQKGRERQKGGEGQESHLLLAGGGPLRRSLAKRIKEEKMENRITLAGEIPHARLPAYYNSADIIINSFTHIPLVREHPLSSVREGLEKGRPICTSLTTLEALSAGKPVILSTVGGTYSGVDHEDLGAVVPDGHPEQMANAIHTLLSDNEKANKMGARAREYVVHNRSWERVTEKMLRVYDFVLRDTG
ncbi:MAG: glycosyltransferase family 4 protein, partial [Thermoplasmata archaeon]|nr:glycosyltransferase family 4 protein [Thermoplasmata archaeon]